MSSFTCEISRGLVKGGELDKSELYERICIFSVPGDECTWKRPQNSACAMPKCAWFDRTR